MRSRKMTISTTVSEEEIRDRLLREHLLDIGGIKAIEDPIPESIDCRITRAKGRQGGYLIETWQDRLPRACVNLLPAPQEGS